MGRSAKTAWPHLQEEGMALTRKDEAVPSSANVERF